MSNASSVNAKPVDKNWAVEYKKLRPQYEEYGHRLRVLSEDLLKSAGIRYHAIECRAKTVESFSEKISRTGKSYSDPLKEVCDLAGLRIIAYYQEDVDKICDLLRKELTVDSALSIDKRSELGVDQFGYMSVHLVVSLSLSRKKLPEWNSFANMVAEVQVRTVLQHAWASISHALQYKREEDIPSQFRRKLVRLAGLLELADEEFLGLKRDQEQAIAAIDEQFVKTDLIIPVDVLSVNKYLNDSLHAQKIVKAAVRQKGLAVSTENISSQLPTICRALGLSTIHDLDQQLRTVQPHAQKFFAAFQAERKYKTAIGSQDHWCTVLLVGAHPEVFTDKALGRLNLWDPEYRGKVILAARSLAWGKRVQPSRPANRRKKKPASR